MDELMLAVLEVLKEANEMGTYPNDVYIHEQLLSNGFDITLRYVQVAIDELLMDGSLMQYGHYRLIEV